MYLILYNTIIRQHIHIQTYTNTHLHTYTHTHAYIYTHTRIHIFTQPLHHTSLWNTMFPERKVQYWHWFSSIFTLTLFLILIDTFPNISFHSYADDIQIYILDSNPNDPFTCSFLRECLGKISNCCKQNSLVQNESKSYAMIIINFQKKVYTY